MRPFILEKHATEYPIMRQLQEEELELAIGGCPTCGPGQFPTLSFSPDDSGPEECDQA